jgi:hypothetical protein
LISKTQFTFKPGYFFNVVENGFLPLFREYLFRKEIHNYSTVKIAVSHEISNELIKIGKRVKTIVVSNSIDVSNFKMRGPVKFKSDVIRFFMLIGFEADWHGVERIVKSLQNYDGDFNLQITFFGCQSQELILKDFKNSKVEFVFLPQIHRNELHEILCEYHIGIGTLAAYKKKMYEASPLKVREYIARGFPIIIGYEDTDLNNQASIEKYVFKVENSDRLIEFKDLVKWFLLISENENYPIDIQQYAYSSLDTSVKMRELVNELTHYVP